MHYVFYWKVLRQSYLLTHDDSQMAWGKLDMMRIIMACHTKMEKVQNYQNFHFH